MLREKCRRPLQIGLTQAMTARHELQLNPTRVKALQNVLPLLRHPTGYGWVYLAA
jgi:hypothetical protein